MSENNPEKIWKQLSSRIAYENPWIKIREDRVLRPDGKEGMYGVLVSHPSVLIVALTNDDEIYCVNQYRYPIEKWSWELPGGGSEGGDLLEAAKRELKEETGLHAEQWDVIGSFEPLNGIASEVSQSFLARKVSGELHAHLVEEGIEGIKKIKLADVLTMIKNGEITCGQSITAIMQAMLFLGKI